MINGVLNFVNNGIIDTTTSIKNKIRSHDGFETEGSDHHDQVGLYFASQSVPDLTLNQTDTERGVDGFALNGAEIDLDTEYDIIDSYADLDICVTENHDDTAEAELNGKSFKSRDNLEINGIGLSEILLSVSPSADVIIAHSTEVNDYDRYGFRKESKYITREAYDKWCDQYTIDSVKKRTKWERFLGASGLLVTNDNSIHLPPKSEKLRSLVREGIPSEWRGTVWWELAGGDQLLQKNEDGYKNLLMRLREHQKKENSSMLPYADIIERDLNRTFPDNIHFQKEPFQSREPAKITSLRNVLLAYSIYNPSVGYCQSMNFLAGLLLLFMEEEKSFWMLVILTKEYLPGVHSLNLEGVNIDQGVLMMIIEEYLPNLNSYIQTTCQPLSPKPAYLRRTNEYLHCLPPITLCTASWFMCCFIGILPIETSLRVWDCMFYEDSCFLFRVSLNLIKLSEEFVLKNKPFKSLFNYLVGTNDYNIPDVKNLPIINSEELNAEMFQALQTLPREMLDTDQFFDRVIFKRRAISNNLTQEHIKCYREYVISQRSKYKRYQQIFRLDFDGTKNLNKPDEPNSDAQDIL